MPQMACEAAAIGNCRIAGANHGPVHSDRDRQHLHRRKWLSPSCLGLTDQNCPHNRVRPDPAPHPRGHEGRQGQGPAAGKQPKLNRRQEAHLVSLVHSGEYRTLEVAELFGVGRSTVYRAIERQRIEARAGLAEATSRR